MRIAVIGAKGLPPKQGGIEHYCAEVYPRMVAQGHSVDLFARSSYTELSWRAEYDFKGVKVISLPCMGKRGIDAFSSSALGAISAIASNYDVVHFHALEPIPLIHEYELESAILLKQNRKKTKWQVGLKD